MQIKIYVDNMGHVRDDYFFVKQSLKRLIDKTSNGAYFLGKAHGGYRSLLCVGDGDPVILGDFKTQREAEITYVKGKLQAIAVMQCMLHGHSGGV